MEFFFSTKTSNNSISLTEALDNYASVTSVDDLTSSFVSNMIINMIVTLSEVRRWYEVVQVIHQTLAYAHL